MANVLAALNQHSSQSWPQRIARALQHSAKALELIQRQALAFDAVDSLISQAAEPPSAPIAAPLATSPTCTTTTTAADAPGPQTAVSNNHNNRVEDKDEKYTPMQQPAPAVKSASSASLGSLGSATSESEVSSTLPRPGAACAAASASASADALEQDFALKSALLVGAAAVLISEAALAEEACAKVGKQELSDQIQLTIYLQGLPRDPQLPKVVALEVKRNVAIVEVATELEKQLYVLQERMTPHHHSRFDVLGFYRDEAVMLLDSCRSYPSDLIALVKCSEDKCSE